MLKTGMSLAPLTPLAIIETCTVLSTLKHQDNSVRSKGQQERASQIAFTCNLGAAMTRAIGQGSFRLKPLNLPLGDGHEAIKKGRTKRSRSSQPTLAVLI